MYTKKETKWLRFLRKYQQKTLGEKYIDLLLAITNNAHIAKIIISIFLLSPYIDSSNHMQEYIENVRDSKKVHTFWFS